MNALQAITEKVAEVTELAAGFLVQATSSLMNTAESLPLDEMSRRLDGALRALRGEEISQNPFLQIACEMVRSYTFDKETGVSTFTVPAGVTDVEAMTAINQYFRKTRPGFNRDAVYAGHLKWLEKLPEEHPRYCQVRDYSQARQITITGVVKGTEGESRSTKERVLEKASLVFSDPRDQALAAAIHACKHTGKDLFEYFCVRGSIPGCALFTDMYRGIVVRSFFDGPPLRHVAASGSPSPNFTYASR